MNEEVVTIQHRFNGPPATANGGYVCGLLASYIGQQADITLLKPPPLDRPMSLIIDDGSEVKLFDQGRLIAIGRPISLAMDIPAVPSFEAARKAEANYIGFKHHAFPTCFVCGPDREAGDGLRIFPGALPGEENVAATWVSDPSTGSVDGFVALEYIWAALDCPGYFAVAGIHQIVAVLGRFAAKIVGRPRINEHCILVGWPMGLDGRKRYAGTALFSNDGRLYGSAKATWYDIQDR